LRSAAQNAIKLSGEEDVGIALVIMLPVLDKSNVTNPFEEILTLEYPVLEDAGEPVKKGKETGRPMT